MKPFVLFENFYEDGTFSVNQGGEAFPKERALDWRMHTQSRWVASDLNVRIEFDVDLGAGGELAAGALGIAGHNLGTLQANVTIESGTDGVAFTPVSGPHSFTDDLPLLVAFDGAPTHQYWRVALDGTRPWSVAPQVGILTLGRRLDFEGGANLSLDPYGFDLDIESNTNNNNSPLGVNVISRPQTFQISYGGGQDPGFTRDGFWRASSGLNVDDDFVAHVNGRERADPFWFAWDLDEDPRSWVCRVDDGWANNFVATYRRRGWEARFKAYREVS